MPKVVPKDAVVISIRTEVETKKRFEEFCDDVGMNPTVAINLFLKAVLREQRLPFEIVSSKDPFYSNENQTRLLQAVHQLNTTGGKVHDLSADRQKND